METKVVTESAQLGPFSNQSKKEKIAFRVGSLPHVDSQRVGTADVRSGTAAATPPTESPRSLLTPDWPPAEVAAAATEGGAY